MVIFSHLNSTENELKWNVSAKKCLDLMGIGGGSNDSLVLFCVQCCMCRKRLSSPRCRSELIDSAWVVIVPGQKCIKNDSLLPITAIKRMSDIFHQESFAEINKEGNKLRTYAKIKLEKGYENYLSIMANVEKCTAVTKIRLSNHDLMIEGRH